MYEQHLISLSDAAKLVGKSRTTLWRAIKSGKLSGEKGDNDQWVVNLSELERVYKTVNVAQQFQNQHVQQVAMGDEHAAQSSISDVLREKARLLEEERDRLRDELSNLRDEMREERQENRQERERLLGVVEQAQKQLTHERSRYDDEIQKARARLKAAAQLKKKQQSANTNKVLREGQGGSSKSVQKGIFGWLRHK